MKQWIQKHRIKIWISSILILCISIGGYLWIRNKQITEAKQDIQYSNHLLSEFHQQKTLYQKVDFLLHKLPNSDKQSPFCRYGYGKEFQENGWREANPITIQVSTTLHRYSDDGYEVLFIKPFLSKESLQHKKYICTLFIEDKSNIEKTYWLCVDNNWNIIESGISNSDKTIPKNQQEKLVSISKKNVNLLFKTVEKSIQQYKERAEKTLKYYHASY